MADNKFGYGPYDADWDQGKFSSNGSDWAGNFLNNLLERIEKLEKCCEKCGMMKVIQVEERLTGGKKGRQGSSD